MRTKATKIDATTWSYRGFTITRNYISPRGTWATCSTQQGWTVSPGRRAAGDWSPSIKEACEDIDRLYARFFDLSEQGKWLVVQAVRSTQRQRNAARRLVQAAATN